ncbi:hypothetical protein Bca52824_079599 [Brassica carinata]|uniref:Uncharacterized protein n=1 Tax=Brassica carinata TaxID=52824 RepID=A0A8X7Q0C7_BRACI|nr:hypothetical protein Bca52824_079599 [Brassica carinata]
MGMAFEDIRIVRSGFSTSSITVLSGRVTEANTSWEKTKCSTSVLQLDPNTWFLEYNLTTDLLAHMMFQAAKNVNRELFWMFSASRNLYSVVRVPQRHQLTLIFLIILIFGNTLLIGFQTSYNVLKTCGLEI